MFQKVTADGYRELLPGIQMQARVHGDRTLLVQFHLDGGSQIPLHTHPHEQTGYLLSGHVVFLTDLGEVDAAAGDSWCFLGNERHGVRVLEDSVIIEVFSPVRLEYLSGQ
ncbi:MAG: cupin domain-containing protein [Anaerolineae bacterium]|nr:cupin domain-containing protein [Anaerolineae bacterium]